MDHNCKSLMAIIYKTINGVEYAEEIYKNEIIRTKVVADIPEEMIINIFTNIKNSIDEKLNTLNPEDRAKEDAKTEVQHITTIDLKNPITTVEDI